MEKNEGRGGLVWQHCSEHAGDEHRACEDDHKEGCCSSREGM